MAHTRVKMRRFATHFCSMLNRRLIRIKTFQALFGEFGQTSTRPSTVSANVKKSMRGMGQNLLAVLSFGPELMHYLTVEHNPTDYKYNPSEEDIRTFNFIAENQFFKDLNENTEYATYANMPSFDWQAEKDLLFLLYKEFKATETYATLTEDYNATEFSLALYKYLLLDSVEFEQLMEDKNIFWYDEKIPILKSLEKIFVDYQSVHRVEIPKLFRNESEDLKMAEDLIDVYFEHKEEMEDTIRKYTPGWESDRITKIDYMLILMALLEFRFMPSIPVKVTMNEYIEIAKMYSTPKSSKFVNGTLDKILKDWKDQDLIKKMGRGLIG